MCMVCEIQPHSTRDMAYVSIIVYIYRANGAVYHISVHLSAVQRLYIVVVFR